VLLLHWETSCEGLRTPAGLQVCPLLVFGYTTEGVQAASEGCKLIAESEAAGWFMRPCNLSCRTRLWLCRHRLVNLQHFSDGAVPICFHFHLLYKTITMCSSHTPGKPQVICQLQVWWLHGQRMGTDRALICAAPGTRAVLVFVRVPVPAAAKAAPWRCRMISTTPVPVKLRCFQTSVLMRLSAAAAVDCISDGSAWQQPLRCFKPSPTLLPDRLRP
jgi:hypothetical protein